MKIFITIIEYVMILIYCIFPTVKEVFTPKPVFEASYKDLGIPLESYYPEGIIARTAWDVEVYDGMLFVAAGDYNANSGPVPIYCYDIANKNWTHSGTVPDEQIENFKIINNTLMVPGCDPQGNWNAGNIYVYNNHQWHTMQNIPGGIHQFDLIEFDGKLFVGLGVLPGEYPIAISQDNGKTFQQTVMYKDGIPLDTSVSASDNNAQIRVYDFFILNDELFAYYSRYADNVITNEIYRYEDNKFSYYCDLPEGLTTKRTSFRPIDQKMQYNGKLYFTTGNLYVTTDFKTATQIPLGENSIVTDICIFDDSLYAITATNNGNGTYRTSLWHIGNGIDAKSREILFFNFPCPAQSFTYYNGTIYFGMGDGILSKNNPYNGSILSVYILG